MRESPTWAIAMRLPSMSAAEAVQPMPGLPRPSSAPLITARLAASIAAPRRVSSAVAGAFSPMVSTAIELATSPAAWPPMPSHTAKHGVRMRNESSLWLLTRPTSERAPHEMNAFLPLVASAPARPSTGMVARPGALTGSWGCVESADEGVPSSRGALLAAETLADACLAAACAPCSTAACFPTTVAVWASGAAASSGASLSGVSGSSAAIIGGSLA